MFVRFGNNTDTQQNPPDGQKVEILSVYTPQPSQGSEHDCLIAAQDVEVALSKSQKLPNRTSDKSGDVSETLAERGW
jgi:hypothetical protein